MDSTFRRLELQAQYASLRQPGNCPEGVFVSPTESVDQWSGVIFVRKGHYKGSVLRFTIAFPASFPLSAPRVTFAQGSLFHPLVDPKDHHLALASGFPRWNAQKDNVSKLLFYIKGIFKDYNLNKLNDGLAINAEAWRLYQSNRAVFVKLATQCATISQTPNNLYARTKTSKEADDLPMQSGGEKSIYTPLTFRQLSAEEMSRLRETLSLSEAEDVGAR